MKPLLIPFTLIWLLQGCASYGNIINKPLSQSEDKARYSVLRTAVSERSPEVTLVVTFSGGGTRAAALSYGVLQALRDSEARIDGSRIRLLDEIDAISSVSGGSFTAAYFGLHGDRIFTDFDEDFLQRDVTGELISGLFSPSLWFSRRGRTEMAVQYYESKVFKGATFDDLLAKNGPLIVINASDLGKGVRFSFLQSYFDLLCSDLGAFPISRAVTASSAVPILFNPVVLKNHADCDVTTDDIIQAARNRFEDSPQMEKILEGLSSYALKQERQYIHLVDGGITDNLGLQAIYEMVEIAGGVGPFLDLLGAEPAPRFVVISVNASTSPQHGMELTNKMPSMETMLNAVTDTQLQWTNTKTLQQFKDGMFRWSAELSSDELRVEPYFVQIDFGSITQPDRRLFINQIPTSFSLTSEQVDELTRAGYELLMSNPEFQRFLADVNQSQ